MKLVWLIVLVLLSFVPVQAQTTLARQVERGVETQMTTVPGGDSDIFVRFLPEKYVRFLNGALRPELKIITNDSTATTRVLLAEETGSVCVLRTVAGSTAAPVSFQLPPAKAGLVFPFIDANATADNDLTIIAGTGDKINGGTAGKKYNCTGDAVKQTVTLVATDDTNWEIVAETGTWSNNNS